MTLLVTTPTRPTTLHPRYPGDPGEVVVTVAPVMDTVTDIVIVIMATPTVVPILTTVNLINVNAGPTALLLTGTHDQTIINPLTPNKPPALLIPARHTTPEQLGSASSISWV